MNYFLIIFIPTILYLFEEIVPTKSKILKKSAIIFIIVIASLRYQFGADFLTYNNVFERIRHGVYTDQFEIGYTFLNKIVAYIDMPFNFLLFIIALFNYVLLYKVIEENLKTNKWLAIFLFLAYFDLFFYSLSAIRQSIVLSIFLYSIRYIKRKQFIRYALWVLFGSLFHQTALLLILFYFFYHRFSRSSFFTISTVMVGIIIVYGYAVRFLDLLRPYMNSKLEFYIFLEDYKSVTNSISMAVVIALLMLFWIFICTKMKTNEETQLKNGSIVEREIISVEMMAIAVFLALKVMQSIYYLPFIPRMQMYFYGFLILAIPKIFQLIRGLERQIAIAGLVFFMIVLFIFRYQELMQYAGIFYEKYKLIFSMYN